MEYIKIKDKYYFYQLSKVDNSEKEYLINTSMLNPHYRRRVNIRCKGLNNITNYEEFLKNIVGEFGENMVFADTIYSSSEFDIVCLVGRGIYDYYLENKNTISSISSYYLK